jgi:murein tripeptide amidase MpaA
LGKTVAGNNVDMICISTKVYHPDELKSRKAIVILSRIHPGETNSSWVVNGLIQFLTSDHPEARYLRNNYVIKIVPMLNPDGVIVGNNRCNLNGFDLNRQWKLEKNIDKVPELVLVKEMISRTVQARQIALFLDFHGHRYNEFN